MTCPTIDAAAERFGFQTRDHDGGFFLAPITRNRFGHRHIGDDVMLVKANGNIVVYEYDAQAFLAAQAVANAMRQS